MLIPWRVILVVTGILGVVDASCLFFSFSSWFEMAEWEHQWIVSYNNLVDTSIAMDFKVVRIEPE